MTSSPSFPSQLTTNKSLGMTSPPPSTSTTPLNLNNSFLGSLGQISNTSNKVPMNQMMPSIQPSFSPNQPTQFQSSANSLSTLSPMIPSQSNAAKRNGQESAVALSAQEINDFLS